MYIHIYTYIKSTINPVCRVASRLTKSIGGSDNQSMYSDNLSM